MVDFRFYIPPLKVVRNYRWIHFFRMRNVYISLDESLCLTISYFENLRYSCHAAVMDRVFGSFQYSVVLVTAVHIHTLTKFNYKSLHSHD